MLNSPFSPWPSFTSEEIEAVSEVLASGRVNYWTGDQIRIFETEFAEFVAAEFAIALANGTVALDLALRTLGIGPGDEVVVTSRTFLASVSAVVNCGATPVFADVDSDSQNISADTVTPVLTNKTKAIICVHLAGWPCDMDPIMQLAKDRSLFVIEDCAQAHGARYKGKSVGSIGQIGCWSFCQDKIMTTGGEGGMITTNDKKLWSAMWSYKDHGKSWEAVYEREHGPGFRWVHDTFGTNWRMTEMQAAIGRIQLKKMQEWNSKRRKNAEAIWEAARSLPNIRVPNLRCSGCDGECDSTRGCTHAAYKCYIFVTDGEAFRDSALSRINEKGVPCFSGSCSEVYLEAAFDDTTFRPRKRLPVAKELGETSLMFLCHPTLTNDEIEKTQLVLSEIAFELSK